MFSDEFSEDFSEWHIGFSEPFPNGYNGYCGAEKSFLPLPMKSE